MGRENAQWAAVRAVEDYIGLNPLVIRLLSEEDGMLRDDGELDLFLPEGEGYDRDYYRPLMADSYHNLALIYRKTNRLKEAKEMAVEAYVIYKRLTRKDSKQWKKTLENTGNLLDDIEARLGR